MINRAISFGVLLFSFALTLIGLQPSGTASLFSVTIPVFSKVAYYVLGAIAIITSLFFFMMGTRRKWTAFTERFLDKKVSFFPTWVLFWGMYTISYIKGFAGVVQASPPAWIVYLVFFFGLIVFLYIGVIGLIKLYK